MKTDLYYKKFESLSIDIKAIIFYKSHFENPLLFSRSWFLTGFLRSGFYKIRSGFSKVGFVENYCLYLINFKAKFEGTFKYCII